MLSIIPYKLQFKQPAGTSRGIYTERTGWYITVDGVISGECAPLPGLSVDYDSCESVLRSLLPDAALIASFKSGVLSTELVERLRPYPSVLFAIESAIWFHKSNGFISVDTKFSRFEAPIIINGLVWMGSYAEMKERMEEKLRQGFRCIKLKIGAIDFDKELSLIEQIRRDFPPEKVTIRVDANGVFTPDEAPDRLRALSAFGIHSIEQPIKAGQWREMAHLCAESPLPIALDEELIGVKTFNEKLQLLTTIRPRYIVLKPTLHGGISGTFEWITVAWSLGIGWWITSALESNVGLTAIAHLCGVVADRYPETASLPQGLGTGALFTTNQPSSLTLKGDMMWWNPSDATVEVQTSGSTGTPKKMMVERARMVESARITCDFLGLQNGDTALLCLPLDYIAGKMMVVRAFERGLRLLTVEPSSEPLKSFAEAAARGENVQIDFAAMIPMQVIRSLENPAQCEILKSIKHLIIGGGAIDSRLADALKSFPNAVWSTYGMTETLSHIALRRLSGPDATLWYTPFKGVSLSLSPQGTLIIDANAVCPEILTTNDIAEIGADGRFRILGRTDNTINTGGVKVQAEEVERLLTDALPRSLAGTFAITSRPDHLLGSKVVLVVQESAYKGSESLFKSAISTLPKYWQPKEVIGVERLPLTPNGKLDRKALNK